MSWPRIPVPAAQLEPQLETVTPPGPKTIAEAVHSMHHAADRMAACVARLEELTRLEQETPEFRTVVINPAASANGPFTAVDDAKWTAKSIAILNPNTVPVYFSSVGSASAAAQSPAAPPNSLLVLPITATTLEMAVDQAALGAMTAVCFVIRFLTVQRAFLGRGA